MKHFVKLGHTYQTNNRLQKHVAHHIQQYDRLLIDSPQQLELYIRRLVETANAAFPRCTPLVVSAYNHDRSETSRSLVIEGIATFSIWLIAGTLAPFDEPAPYHRPKIERSGTITGDGEQLSVFN